MNPLMKLGYSKNLEMEDLWNLNKSESASYNSDIFQASWEAENKKTNPSFVMALIRTYGAVFCSAGIFKAFQDALAFLQPQFLKMLLVFAGTWSTPDAESPDPISNGFVIAVSFNDLN
jgi:ATP-binding cassette subfamily C (CFTR/MRP) protein 1